MIRCLNPVDHNPSRNTKADKDFAKIFNFKDIKFPVKIRYIHNIEKKNFISISVFGYENKVKYLCIKKCYEDKHVDLLLIGKE